MSYASQILGPSQRVIYSQNGKVVCVVGYDFLLDYSLAHHIRYVQPFTEAGQGLIIPLPDEREMLTSPVDSLTIVSNALQFDTMNTEYDILYPGINLEEVLRVGGPKNKDNPDGDLTLFPHL